VIVKTTFKYAMFMGSFLSDCRPATSSAESEAFVISRSYRMGDPLAPSEVEGNREGGGLPASGRERPGIEEKIP
jgi:hypothetical protein